MGFWRTYWDNDDEPELPDPKKRYLTAEEVKEKIRRRKLKQYLQRESKRAYIRLELMRWADDGGPGPTR